MSEHTLEIMKCTHEKTKPDPDSLVFGTVFTDHMFIMDYSEEKGWYSPRIIPYQPLTLDPASMVFHYGQTVFEGLKAYRSKEDGTIRLFRPDMNIKRLNRSSERLTIPPVDEEQLLSYLKELLIIDKKWIPEKEGTSLYIRPFIISTEPNLSVAPSHSYKLMVILSPVGAYYKEGMSPVSILVEERYTRAAPGGTGTAKTAGNYCSAYKAQERATAKQKSQVLWLDASEKKYVEEVGSMNVFFKINGEIVTPKLNDSILDGVTRNSVIQVLKDWGLTVKEQQVEIEEIFQAHRDGVLEEVFGTGTAAVISPVGQLEWNDENITIHNNETGPLAQKLYNYLTDLHVGKEEDRFGWIVEIDND
ncbi:MULTISPECIES: branched-chain amino acid aminotransferase [Shouchella]|uniref:Branched-chain-amino-acid aminotransferase n=2 Tax=Shouchella TaxID=2893057 RepID=A0ABY7W957_9BACI|nr:MULTISPECIES: branched-chain amino acid aminotransferase [Shouchella]MED4129886.1 branched-chain amino acid aminotransferase [Shouchella miscanthi]WDF03225.1 branched-chain amino acid aminotransferase [Shouchella hunanensis]